MLRRVVLLALVLALPAPALAARPAEPPQPTQQDRDAAVVGLTAAATSQTIAMVTTIVWAGGLDPAGVSSTLYVPMNIANLPLSVAGIAGWEGAFRDGTWQARYRGLGAGFMQGAGYSFAMAGILLVGTFGPNDRCADDCIEDLTPLFSIPQAATYSGVGLAFLGLGLGHLIAADRERLGTLRDEVVRVRATPSLVISAERVSIGVIWTW